MTSEDKDNPCVHCGACCASFRVSFYFAEAIANHLPGTAVERINDRFSCMAGTNSGAPREERMVLLNGTRTRQMR